MGSVPGAPSTELLFPTPGKAFTPEHLEGAAGAAGTVLNKIFVRHVDSASNLLWHQQAGGRWRGGQGHTHLGLASGLLEDHP